MIVLHPHIPGHEHYLMVSELQVPGGPCEAVLRDVCAIFVSANDPHLDDSWEIVHHRARMISETGFEVVLFPVSRERFDDEKAASEGDEDAAERVHHFYEEGGEDRLALAIGGDG